MGVGGRHDQIIIYWHTENNSSPSRKRVGWHVQFIATGEYPPPTFTPPSAPVSCRFHLEDRRRSLSLSLSYLF